MFYFKGISNRFVFRPEAFYKRISLENFLWFWVGEQHITAAKKLVRYVEYHCQYGRVQIVIMPTFNQSLRSSYALVSLKEGVMPVKEIPEDL